MTNQRAKKRERSSERANVRASERASERASQRGPERRAEEGGESRVRDREGKSGCLATSHLVRSQPAIRPATLLWSLLVIVVVVVVVVARATIERRAERNGVPFVSIPFYSVAGSGFLSESLRVAIGREKIYIYIHIYIYSEREGGEGREKEKEFFFLHLS